MFIFNPFMLAAKNNFFATGGTKTQVGNYMVHTFTSSGSFQVLSGAKNVEYFVVGGGGGSGSYSSINGTGGSGGGGGGNVVYYSTGTITQDTIDVVVGNGGSVGNNGGTSSITFTTNASNNRNAIGEVPEW